AGGARKVTPILGGLRGRLMNVLVTDENTAQQILAANKARPGGREAAGDA
ncbi:MAG: sugar-binding domain-containing protein, partial [Patescibacteria group bacterium]